MQLNGLYIHLHLHGRRYPSEDAPKHLARIQTYGVILHQPRFKARANKAKIPVKDLRFNVLDAPF